MLALLGGDAMNIYQRIRMLRESQNMSQDTLAKKCGYTGRQMISQIESGKVDLPLSKVEAIARALNVNAAYLAGYDPDQNLRDRALLVSDLIEKAALLDSEDRARVAERIDMLLEAEKYK